MPYKQMGYSFYLLFLGYVPRRDKKHGNSRQLGTTATQIQSQALNLGYGEEIFFSSSNRSQRLYILESSAERASASNLMRDISLGSF